MGGKAGRSRDAGSGETRKTGFVRDFIAAWNDNDLDRIPSFFGPESVDLTRREALRAGGVLGATALWGGILPRGAMATPTPSHPSAEMRYEKKRMSVLDRNMAYVEIGGGDPIVFLHGNPTSSYLWRNVIPQLEDRGRCIAPDLIGMGDSDKLPPARQDGHDGRYRFVEHRRYLDALFEGLDLRRKVILVLHDWGSGLGFDWARRHPERVKGIAYMEAIVRSPSWSQMDFLPWLLFKAMRGFLGEYLVIDQNLFIERIMPRSVLRGLSEAELDAYRAPYRNGGEDRRPILTWPREIPFDGDPPDVYEIVESYSNWLTQSADLPKLFINGEPGAILSGEARAFARTFPNQSEVTVAGLHYLQEDSPAEIGEAIATWIDQLA